jgi:hypothetical protein
VTRPDGLSVGTRSEVTSHAADRPGNGSSRTWSREIAGTLYAFTLVTMPDGEVRVFVQRFNGYVGGTRFACAWETVRVWHLEGSA